MNSQADRAVGKFPLSIATSLAIESACNIHDEVKHASVPVLHYKQIWINMRTLFRNYMGSLTTNGAALVLPAQIAQDLYHEMGAILQAIGEASRGTCQVVFYVSDYNGVERYRYAVPWMDNTDKQRVYTQLQKAAIEMLLKEQKDFEIRTFALKLTGRDTQSNPKSLILTHYAFDLLSAKAFAELVLLESHTGNLKDKTLWYTKYMNGKTLPVMPFREDFIQIFGDSETFRPADAKLRKEIIELAKKYHWNATTTSERIRFCVNQMTHHYARDLIKQILV